MHAAVPITTPACVAAAVSVGDVETSGPDASTVYALAGPKSSTLTLPSGVNFTLTGFKSPLHDPLAVGLVQSVGDLDP